MGRAFIHLSARALQEVLVKYLPALPPDIRPIAVRHDPFIDAFDILLDSASWESVVEGGMEPPLWPQATFGRSDLADNL